MSDKSDRSPWPVSRRTFLGIMAGSGALCAGEPRNADGLPPENSGSENGPVDLLPRLTPKPTRVAGIAQPCVDLNGVWRFNPRPAADFWNGRTEGDWSNIQVPGEWTMQGFTVEPQHAGGYCLRLPVPADWSGHRVKVRFDAVYSQADVWMNGVLVGSHLGAFTPFEVDLSAAVMPGKENLLALAVKSESLADILTVGREMVGHAMGGIIRNVRIFAVPEVNLSSLHVETTFDEDFRNSILHVLLNVSNEGGVDLKNGEVQFALREYGPDRKPIALDPATVQLPMIRAGETASQVIDIPVQAPKKWDAEHPNLYVLEAQLKTGNQLSLTERRFGFRQVNIKDGRFLLNGQPIRLRGISRQDSHPLMGRTMPPEVQRQQIDWITWANCKNTYTCAFLPDEESVNLCDETGIYVMDEPGTCWVGIAAHAHDLEGRDFWKNEKIDDPKYFPLYLQPALEMIERDRSHPSVITWMLADESTCGKNFREVLKVVRVTDASRPVHIAYDPACGQKGPAGKSPFDLGSWHYPTAKMFAAAAESKRPVVFDQSVSAYFANVPELMTDPGIRDEWGLEYVPFWEKLWATGSILGGQAFNLNDDQYVLPSGLITGNGDWGFVDPWCRAKPDLYHIRKAHTPVKIQDAPLPVPAAGQPLEIPIENRFDFTDLREVRVEWSVGDESGTVPMELPPHAKGTVSIQTKSRNLNGKILSLNFIRNDKLVDAYKLMIGEPTEPVPASTSNRIAKPELVHTTETIEIRGHGFEWVVSRQTGQIIRATRHGQRVLVGGPVLMLLPSAEYPMTPGYPKPRPQAFPLSNPLCRDWKATALVGKHVENGVEIDVTGQYQEASGDYTLRIDGEGNATIRYHFTYNGPEKIFPRQTGMVLYTPRGFDTLTWKRKAQWSVYPDDHIGRPEGMAKALPDASLVDKSGTWMEVAYREKPTWPWSMDANALGTRDFRATRRSILHASLKDSAGCGITVLSDGRQHARAFLDGDRIGFLVAGYSGPGGVTSWLRGLIEIAGLQIPALQAGSEVKDTIRLALAGPRQI